MKLADKVAIVTGSSSTIGRSIACMFAKEGAKVVVADIDADGGEETVAAIKADGGEAIYVQADISIDSEVQRLVKETRDKFGKINILVNDAAVMPTRTSAEDIDESHWDKIFAVNVKGMFLTSKYTAPLMKKSGGGVIINIGSSAGISPRKLSAAYAASKGAVRMFSRALALDLAPDIRVNCINPGLVDTPRARQRAKESGEILGSNIPLGRIVSPEDIAYAALFLASDESSIITGADINLHGGSEI